jgi:uncharacterized repeat protein (TIGR01451 family)
MKRRWKLIALAALLVALGSVNAVQYHAATSSPAHSPTQVAIAEAASWPVSNAEVEALVREAVALAGGLGDIIDVGDTVVIKPNLAWGTSPDEGYTTDPLVTRTVVQMAQEAGAGQVIIAEGAALYHDWHDDRGATIEAFQRCGYDANGDLLDDVTNVPLVDLNDSGGLDQHDPNLVRQVHLQNGLIWSEYWLPNVILDADVLIGIPVLKNHSRAGVTLALKNQIGIVPSDIYHNPGMKMLKGGLSHSAADLGRHIVDLNLARPLDFALIDGLRGITNGSLGEGAANPPMKLILASHDAVALDAIGTLVMGYDPTTVPYLGWAAGAGLGTADVSQITVRGERVRQVRRDFPAPWGDPQAQRAESTPPTVSVTSPGEGQTVTSNVTVSATASDDSAVSKVEFYVADELQAVVTTPPYQAALDLSAHLGQAVTLRAVTYDGALNDAEDNRSVTVVQPHVPGTVSFYTATLTIPTYLYADCLETDYSATYNMTYKTLDRGCYDGSYTAPVDYKLLVLENDYLRVTLLPELGGRVYQMTYKPTGHNELYQNPVIKPTHWGPPEQGWWMAVGGIEWCLPVDEHGYEWVEPWSWSAITSTTGVTVTLQDTVASDRIRARIGVSMDADQSYLVIAPQIENPTGSPIDYKYWSNAMITPGAANTVGANLRTIINTDEVSIHSTGDERLPGTWPTPITGPDYRISWPIYDGIDFSRLGNWDEWGGFFEYPQAGGDFAGVYDTAADEGLVRVFPSDVSRGTKGFGMGWDDQINAGVWTDDGSTYYELHGGVEPTFWDEATLSAGETLEWKEIWYPVSGIGHLRAATAEAALGVRRSGGYFHVAAHTTKPRDADTSTLYAWDRNTCAELDHWTLPAIGPGQPFATSVRAGGRALDDLSLVLLDEDGSLLAAVNPLDCLPPTSSIEPLPAWVTTAAFTVTWAGQDVWSGIESYDVQVREGYGGTWTDWLTATTATSATLTGEHGHTYFFRVRARDQLGSEEPFGDTEWGQTFTTVLTEPAAVLVTSNKRAPRPYFDADQTVAYIVTISNTGNLTSTAALTDTPPTGMILLTGTLAASSGPAPICAEGAIRWSGDVLPGAEVQVTYTLSPTAVITYGEPLTNTAEIAGSVLGPLTRQETIMRMYQMWLPLAMRAWEP